MDAWRNKCCTSRKMISPITPWRKTSQCWTSILGFRLCRVIWNFNLVIERYVYNVISLRISEVTADDVGGLHFQPWRVLWALSWIQHHLIYRDCLLVHHCALSKHFKKIKENSKSLKKSRIEFLFRSSLSRLPHLSSPCSCLSGSSYCSPSLISSWSLFPKRFWFPVLLSQRSVAWFWWYVRQDSRVSCLTNSSRLCGCFLSSSLSTDLWTVSHGQLEHHFPAEWEPLEMLCYFQ